MWLSEKVLPQKSLYLKAKKLLYSIDIEINCKKTKDRVVLSAEGPVRIGPLSQKISIQTEYMNTDKLTFKKHSFKTDSKVSYQYEYREKKLFLETSKSDSIIEMNLPNKVWRDPLSLLLQIYYDFNGDRLADEYLVLINKKFTEIKSFRNNKSTHFEKSGKRQFSLEKSTKGSLLILVDKFKAKAELSS